MRMSSSLWPIMDGQGRWRGQLGGWGQGGVSKGKHELVANTTSFLPGAAAGRGLGGVRGRGGQRQKRISVRH